MESLIQRTGRFSIDLAKDSSMFNAHVPKVLEVLTPSRTPARKGLPLGMVQFAC